MSRAAYLAAAGAILSMQVSTASAQTWVATNTKDAITDKITRDACSTQSEFRLCLTFEDTGVWATVRSMGSDLFDTQLFPAVRVDQNKAMESVDALTLSMERDFGFKIIPRTWQPTYLTWRAQVPSPSGKWTNSPPTLVSQMITGKVLLVRVYLSGGFQKDVTFSLDGFCRAAAQVYAAAAPPLVCP